MITLYSTECPKCKVLEMKLEKKNIEHTINTNVQEMLAAGIRTAPTLRLNDGTLLQFNDAVKWVNAQ